MNADRAEWQNRQNKGASPEASEKLLSPGLACLAAPAASFRRAMSVESFPIPVPRDAPWVAGLRAARANLIPGLIVQAIMLGLLLAYWFYPPTTLMLDRLALVIDVPL